MRFSSLFVLASVAISSYAATVAEVESDIATISTQLTTLDNDINNVDTSTTTTTLEGALTVHDDAVTLGNTVDSTTADVESVPLPISDSDGQTILADLQALQPTIDNALSQIVVLLPALEQVNLENLAGLVQEDLANLNTSTFNLAAALIAAAPSSILTAAETLQSQLLASFATAINAYAGA
ncbi:hypothetical protein H0H92_010180 [Tricholoma furcatifolium]|nr:hypothetical protein H0H92_010180 [Tricholoma furcatifolium]